MKLRGIPVKGIDIGKDGKVKPKPGYRSVSQKIAARKSKKVRVKRRTP